jgi:hypothetical protein
MDATTWFCHIAREVNALLDRGENIDPAETKRHMRDETLLAWIDASFPSPTLALASIPPDGQLVVFENFKDMAMVGTESSYGVTRNGLGLVAAYCIESIQRLHPPTPDEDPDR